MLVSRARPQCIRGPGHGLTQKLLVVNRRAALLFTDARATGLSLVRLNVELERLDTLLANKNALQLKILMLCLSAVFVVVQVVIQHFAELAFAEDALDVLDDTNHTVK